MVPDSGVPAAQPTLNEVPAAAGTVAFRFVSEQLVDVLIGGAVASLSGAVVALMTEHRNRREWRRQARLAPPAKAIRALQRWPKSAVSCPVSTVGVSGVGFVKISGPACRRADSRAELSERRNTFGVRRGCGTGSGAGRRAPSGSCVDGEACAVRGVDPLGTPNETPGRLSFLRRRPSVRDRLEVEDVSSSVELRWRPDDDQAAFTV